MNLSPDAEGTIPDATLRVLVVDDNEDGADTVGLLVKLWGAKVWVAYDGVSGHTLARTFRPDVVLLDIAMPGVDGYQLARQLRQDPGLKQVILVAVTGYADPAHRRRALAGGFDHYLAKPAEFKDLERLLAVARRAKHFSVSPDTVTSGNTGGVLKGPSPPAGGIPVRVDDKADHA
jgi:CheY-like chemotaxis protein